MPSQALPEPEDLREIFNGLLGRDVTVVRGHPDSIGLEKPVIVAVYDREDEKIGGLVVADLSIAAYAGAALALIPKGMADENIRDGVIEDNLLENFHEVLNVGARWFTARSNPRVKLGNVYPAGVRPTTEVATVMAGPADRVDLDVTVAGYGSGRVRLLATAF